MVFCSTLSIIYGAVQVAKELLDGANWAVLYRWSPVLLSFIQVVVIAVVIVVIGQRPRVTAGAPALVQSVLRQFHRWWLLIWIGLLAIYINVMGTEYTVIGFNQTFAAETKSKPVLASIPDLDPKSTSVYQKCNWIRADAGKTVDRSQYDGWCLANTVLQISAHALHNLTTIFFVFCFLIFVRIRGARSEADLEAPWLLAFVLFFIALSADVAFKFVPEWRATNPFVLTPIVFSLAGLSIILLVSRIDNDTILLPIWASVPLYFYGILQPVMAAGGLSEDTPLLSIGVVLALVLKLLLFLVILWLHETTRLEGYLRACVAAGPPVAPQSPARGGPKV